MDQANSPKEDDYDFYLYFGDISSKGYENISEELKKATRKKALLILFTYGGDPHSAFRIARAFQHHYESFDVLIPKKCKSAGSLIAMGAHTLYMCNMSELGPLDVQLKRKDELSAYASGLDIAHALNRLQTQAISVFRNNLLELTLQAGLSTRVAADIASKLTCGLFEPIFSQVDPMNLSETQRALEIALAYGTRLNEKSQNLHPDALSEIVTSYPSHSFVIDRKEAKKLFKRIERPTAAMAELSDKWLNVLSSISCETDLFAVKIELNEGVKDHESKPDTSNARNCEAGVSEAQPKVDGSSEPSTESVTTSKTNGTTALSSKRKNN